jgi:hypothetical protein
MHRSTEGNINPKAGRHCNKVVSIMVRSRLRWSENWNNSGTGNWWRLNEMKCEFEMWKIYLINQSFHCSLFIVHCFIWHMCHNLNFIIWSWFSDSDWKWWTINMTENEKVSLGLYNFHLFMMLNSIVHWFIRSVNDSMVQLFNDSCTTLTSIFCDSPIFSEFNDSILISIEKWKFQYDWRQKERMMKWRMDDKMRNTCELSISHSMVDIFDFKGSMKNWDSSSMRMTWIDPGTDRVLEVTLNEQRTVKARE